MQVVFSCSPKHITFTRELYAAEPSCCSPAACLPGASLSVGQRAFWCFIFCWQHSSPLWGSTSHPSGHPSSNPTHCSHPQCPHPTCATLILHNALSTHVLLGLLASGDLELKILSSSQHQTYGYHAAVFCIVSDWRVVWWLSELQSMGNGPCSNPSVLLLTGLLCMPAVSQKRKKICIVLPRQSWFLTAFIVAITKVFGAYPRDGFSSGCFWNGSHMKRHS